MTRDRTTTVHHRTHADASRRHQVARAGVSLLASALALAGCTGTPTPGLGVGPPTAASATASASSSPTPATAVRGLPSMQDFPVEVTPGPGWVVSESDPGALAFRDTQGIRTIAVHAIGELAGTEQAEVPADVAGFLASHRPDVLVTGGREVRHSGLRAQRFRVEVKDGVAPRKLWSVDDVGFKPLATAPMEVVAVRSSAGLLWLWTEWEPENEAETLAAFDAALKNVTVR